MQKEQHKVLFERYIDQISVYPAKSYFSHGSYLCLAAC
ncbi:hypothetical protein JCM19233_6334 [Vibrio astriarenae]|nr:hypothetical protein JCM19233_6334 [Vibrio sp. C7]